MKVFQEMVEAELKKAREQHPAINSLDEGYAVILEEIDELWDEVRKKQALRNSLRVVEELVQIGAMCQREAEDVVMEGHKS